MGDAVFLGLLLALFGASIALIRACARIVDGVGFDVIDATAGEPRFVRRAA